MKGRLYKPYYRNGQQHRGGADVSFTDIVKVFGFRKISIGKWVTVEEQQIAANLFFDALCDLMDILAVPETIISLRGSLSLSFGIGGHKSTCAHYNSHKRELALAKNAGGGSLAHEWFHAFDHYICSKVFTNTSSHRFATDIWLNAQHDLLTHPLNEQLGKSFTAIFLSSVGTEPSNLMKNSIAIDSLYQLFYYARPQEVGARAFERMVENHPIKNNFLVYGSIHSPEAQKGLYPSEDEIGAISLPFMQYFSWLGKALNNNE